GAGIDVLWLDTLQRISARVAHEMKGALNGVSVNLEVVRSRCEKPNAAASAVSRYADAATGQLGTVIAMTDAMLALARPPREPAEIAVLLRRLEALLAPSARAEGHALELAEPLDPLEDGGGATTAPAGAVRLALGSAM